ncbi:hypothetical protein JCM6882_008862 [Rhodosporidiobolus microsporus]
MSSLQLQTAKLPGNLEVAYFDSFASLAESDRPKEYTTVIGLHGTGFNSVGWAPIIPHLPPSIRFLAFNQRSYAGSSPAFETKQPGAVDATAQYVVDTMEFFNYAVEELGAKKKEEGGVVLMGWSKGNVLTISLLSHLHASSAPSPTSFAAYLPSSGLPHASLIKTHLRAILFYEPAGSALGRPPTADLTNAMGSVFPPNTPTPEEFATAFAGWIGDYSPPTATSPEPTASLPASGLAALPAELRSTVWEPDVVAHGFAWRISPSPAEVQELAKLGLAPEGELAVPLGLFYGGRSVGYCMDASAEIQRWWGVKEGGDKSGQRKNTAVRRIEGTNHFGFLHEPEAFIKNMVELIDELSQ